MTLFAVLAAARDEDRRIVCSLRCTEMQKHHRAIKKRLKLQSASQVRLTFGASHWLLLSVCVCSGAAAQLKSSCATAVFYDSTVMYSALSRVTATVMFSYTH